MFMSLLVVSLLILLCPEAKAQSWILWQQTDGKSFKKWEAVRGYPTYQACQHDRDFWLNLTPLGDKFQEIVKKSPSTWNPECPKCLWVTEMSGEKYLVFKEDGIETIVMAPNRIIRGSRGVGYLVVTNECFPDTVDPRK
jgi:hypothetical protein